MDQARILGNSFTSKKGILLGGKIVDGRIKWTDGSPTDFTYWEDGYPPVNHRECLAVFRQLKWRDVECQDDGQKLETVWICQLSMEIRQGKPNQNLTNIIIILAMVLLFLTLGFSIKVFQNLLMKLLSITSSNIRLISYHHNSGIDNGIVELTSVGQKIVGQK